MNHNPSKKRVPAWVQTLIKLGLATLLIYWVIRRGGLDFELLQDLLTLEVALPCLFLIFINISLVSERWRSLISARGVDITAWEAFKLTFIGNFFNFAMPGAVGGDVIKGYYLAKKSPGKRMLTAMSVLVDRLLGFYVMLILALSVLVWNFAETTAQKDLLFIFYGVLFFFTGFTVFFIFSFSRRNRMVLHGLNLLSNLPGHAILEKIYQALHAYGESKKVLLWALLVSFVAQFSSILFFWWVGQIMEQSMGVPDINFATYVMVVPLGFIVTALPLAPAGIGVGQAAFLYLFNLVVGEPTPLGATGVTLFQIGLFFYGGFGALFYLRQKNEIEEGRSHG